MHHVDTLVIGAGVVGLASAAALALKGQEVFVLERETSIGQGISSRNSEVIHAGIYYPENSLKAELCVRGKELLYDFCNKHDVPHKRLGKLLIATEDEEIPKLEDMQRRGLINGVEDLELLSRKEALALEPELNAVTALWSPSTGIIDTHYLMFCLQGTLENYGGLVVCQAEVSNIEATDKGVLVHANGETFLARQLINAAGLDAVNLTRAIDGISLNALPEASFAKGNYFKLAGQAPFSHLIYPAPVPGGLGTHLTIDMGGQARFGPDVEWGMASNDEFDFEVNPARSDSFYEAIRRYWPALPDGALMPDYAGVRPKITWPDDRDVDFEISTPDKHGIPGFYSLLGIESPGLTASLA
ncbi:NAD(P)/FAD-dependent oxidoreductase, partial [Alphaproteobacteria bacterium]|nr:NAD(P)/FAD-dependent oxidoreductase [Alphaproteobacteria bacterium]